MLIYRIMLYLCKCNAFMASHDQRVLFLEKRKVSLPNLRGIIPPIVVMSLLMLSFNLLADGLREALDPKMKSM